MSAGAGRPPPPAGFPRSMLRTQTCLREIRSETLMFLKP